MYCFAESLHLPALGSEELDTLCQKLEQQLPKAALQPHVAPALANPKLTDNSAAAFSSSGSARVDLFFKCEGGQDAMMVGEEADEGFDTILFQVCKPCRIARLLTVACHHYDYADANCWDEVLPGYYLSDRPTAWCVHQLCTCTQYKDRQPNASL